MELKTRLKVEIILSCCIAAWWFKGTKLHFKSPTAERRHVLCVGVGRDRTRAARSRRAGYAALPTRLWGHDSKVLDQPEKNADLPTWSKSLDIFPIGQIFSTFHPLVHCVVVTWATARLISAQTWNHASGSDAADAGSAWGDTACQWLVAWNCPEYTKCIYCYSSCHCDMINLKLNHSNWSI